MSRDADGWKRGEKGYARCKTDAEFLKPDFDRKRQVGEKAVGMFATADHPGVVNARLEGDDV